MAATQNTMETTYAAGESMEDWQYQAVIVDETPSATLGKGEKQVIKVDIAGDAGKFAYILQNKPRQGEGAIVVFGGRTLAVAGAAFAVEAELSVNAAGKLITRAGAGFVIARALEAAAAADEVVEVIVVQYYRA